MADRAIDADQFALAIGEILSDVERGVDESVMPAVRKGLRVGVKVEKELAPVLSGRYKSGITSTTRKKGNETYGEIGNKKSPGLAHLLEKGHARTGGGRVAERRHIAPAAERAFQAFEEELDKRIEGALK